MKNGVIDIRRMAKLALIAAGLGLGGCASQQTMDGVMEENRTLKERNEELARQNSAMQTENGLLQRQRTANEAAVATLTQQNEALKKQLLDAGMSLDEIRRAMIGMNLTKLDPETDRALSALASQYPEYIKYDSATGMLRFSSDLTFNSGDDTVQEGAKASLAALAKILNSAAAAQYEVFVVGHTDAQKISSRTAARHPTNMHLSAHRAISVRSALSSLGVPADKVYVAGWGEFRPIVPNSGNGNTPANRRVEIYLTRPTGSEVAQTPTTRTETSAPTREPEMVK